MWEQTRKQASDCVVDSDSTKATSDNEDDWLISRETCILKTGEAVAIEKLSADRGTGQNSFLFREILKCLREVTAYFCSGRDADLVSKSRSHIRLMNDGWDFKVLCGENNWNSHKTAL